VKLSSCCRAAGTVKGGLKESAREVVLCRKLRRRLFRSTGSSAGVVSTVDSISLDMEAKALLVRSMAVFDVPNPRYNQRSGLRWIRKDVRV
jgi:hypothetical protein